MNYVIILAGGIGSRMNMGSFPKQYLMYENRPIISYCLRIFQANKETDKIIIVANEEWRKFILTWVENDGIDKFIEFAEPGETRQYSIINGLHIVSKYADSNDIVMVHDAARPLVSDELITECYRNIKGHDGVMPALPAKDTFYLSDNGKKIENLIPRNKLFAGQAPEAFYFGKYLKANEEMPENELLKINGSTEIAFKAGLDVAIINGSEKNIKITTQNDLELMKMYMEEK